MPARIDLHVHSLERSACGTASDAEMIEQAIARGLQGLAFCDHDRCLPADRAAELTRIYAPFRVYTGIEVTVRGLHFLVYGLRDPALESGCWNYEGLRAYAARRGGFVALAHPFRWSGEDDPDLASLPPDGLEVCSSNMTPAISRRSAALARELRLSPLCSSDAHEPELLGGFFNAFDSLPRDDAELVAMLRARRHVPRVEPARMPPAAAETWRKVNFGPAAAS